MVWSNAESPAHYKDQYRDQSRDQYKDQYRDQYRDHYKDQYRDQYRDPQRDLYRDHQRDPYRDQYRDPHRDQAPLGKPPTPLGSPYRVLPPIGLSDTEEVGLEVFSIGLSIQCIDPCIHSMCCCFEDGSFLAWI